jgi:transcriptional regulator of NAD metabolism
MNGEIRRAKIENILKSSAVPVPGVTLAKNLDVSRQIIVSDIALLRANGLTILSTNKGVVTDKEARKLQVGGEVLAFVW